MMAGVPVGDTTLLAKLKEADEKATPGPWQEDGTLWNGGRMIETDASANDGEDWITFKSRRADEDRALFIALRDALPAVVTLIQAADAACRGTAGDGTIRALRAALAPFVGEATQPNG